MGEGVITDRMLWQAGRRWEPVEDKRERDRLKPGTAQGGSLMVADSTCDARRQECENYAKMWGMRLCKTMHRISDHNFPPLPTSRFINMI